MVLTVSHVQTSQTLHELCNAKNKPIHMLEESESEVLIINSTVDTQTHNLRLSRVKNKCRLEYKVCPSCHFEIVLKDLTIPCYRPECRCGFLEIEETFPQQKLKYCGNYNESVMHFESKTRHVKLDFVQMGNVFNIALNITARRNHYTITGMPGSEHFIQSPFFPSKYPPDYGAEYTFHSLDPKGCVQLLFLDFQLLPQSYIEVSGHSSYRVDTYNGDIFRPPAFTSQGIQLTLKFEAHGMLASSKAGFRAKYNFFRSDWKFAIEAPYTDCGGTAKSYGGIMAVNAPDGVGLVDCIWLLYPPLFSHRSLFSAMIREFQNTGIGSVLEFRKGLTSLAPAVKTIECSISGCPTERSEITISASVGVYIRFRGHMKKESSLIISYCTFKDGECTGDEFECANGRCIQKFLQCDGYDHCTDNSDEEKCHDDIIISTTSMSTRMITGVPQVIRERIPAGVVSLIAITAISGLSIGILACILIRNKFYRTRPVRRESRQVQHRISDVAQIQHRISDVGGEAPVLHVRQIEENPPSYEDVLKHSERFPHLSYASQADAETNCSFTDFQCTSEETLRASHENFHGSMHNSQYNLRNSTVTCASHSSGSTPDACHLSFASNSCSVIHPSEYAIKKCIHESTRKLCRSLESKVNQCCCHYSCSNIHVIKHEYVVLQTLPYKHVRCMTLPPNYKFPQRERSKSNRGSSCNVQEVNSCSSATEKEMKECNCSVINEILPVAKNRCFSDPYQVTVLDLHSFFRKKASTF